MRAYKVLHCLDYPTINARSHEGNETEKALLTGNGNLEFSRLHNGIFQGSNRLVETIMRGVQKGVSKKGINIVDSDSLTRKIEFIHLNLLYIFFFASNTKKTSDDDAH